MDNRTQGVATLTFQLDPAVVALWVSRAAESDLTTLAGVQAFLAAGVPSDVVAVSTVVGTVDKF